MKTEIAKGGVYLVVDPSMSKEKLLQKLSIVLLENICAVQVWDNMNNIDNVDALLKSICDLCAKHNTPVLINNQWQLLKQYDFDGIHFDELPQDIQAIKQEIGKDFICGVTCNNEITVAEKAAAMQFDYVSFCSMFPSSTSNSCELVSFETVQKVTAVTNLPVFLAGGIRLENIDSLNELNYAGIAVTSGIMSAENPQLITQQYQQKINQHIYDKQNH